MPHPEQEHGLMIEVARLRRECNSLHTRLASEKARADRNAREVAETLDALSKATDRTVAAQEALAAARRECEGLRDAAKEAESLILWLAMKEARDKYGSPWRRCVVCDRPSKHGDTDKQSHESNCAILLHLQKPSIRTALAAPGDGEEGKR